jgi:DNA invertase Pin-like site-specific DNA recombinase
MKLIPVIRVSTEGQKKDDKAGLPRQRDAVAAVVASTAATRLDIPGTPEISDVSGSDLADAPEWKIVLRLLDEHPDAHVCADDLTRIIRADAFDLRVLGDLKRRGRRIYLQGGKVYDTTDARDVMVLTIFAGVGGYDKAENKRKNWAAKEAKRRRGVWVSRIDALPIGITFNRKGAVWGTDEKADDVREAFRRLVENAEPRSSLADLLGVSLAGVGVVLRNPIYRGILRYDQKRGDPYPSKDGRQPARRKVARDESEVIEVRVFDPDRQVVTDAMWYAAQDRLETRKRTHTKRKDRTAPDIWASGFLYSAHEEFWSPRPDGFFDYDPTIILRHVVYGHGGGVNKPARYVCRCGHGGRDPGRPTKKCGLGHLRAETVNAALDEYLRRMTTEDWFIGAVREEIRTPKIDTNAERNRLTRVLKTLDARSVRVRDMYERGDFDGDRAEFERRRDAIREERRAATDALSSLDEFPSAPTEAQLTALARDWVFNPSWTHDRKRAWLRRYVRHIGIGNEGIESVVVAVPVTVPGESGEVAFRSAMFAGGIRMTWDELIGGSPFNPESRLAAEGRLVAGYVAARLGITVARLAYLVRCGVFAPPTGAMWGAKKTWTESDVATYQRILPTVTDKRHKVEQVPTGVAVQIPA